MDLQWVDGLEKLLSVFISFMLGVYIQQAFKRWWGTALEFEGFLESYKQMSCYLQAIGVDKTDIARMDRYGLSLCYILSVEAECSQTMRDDADAVKNATLQWLSDKTYLQDDELEDLEGPDPCAAAWRKSAILSAWLGEVIAHCQFDAADGGTRATVPPPMRVRMIALWQDNLRRIDTLKTYVVLQVPYIYAQLLAVLVHLNNVILAVSSGLVISETVAEAKHLGSEGRAMWPKLVTACGHVLLILGEVMLFTSFLHIAQLLSYPFGSETHNLPTETFVARLQAELFLMAEGRQSHQRRERKRNQGLSSTAATKKADDGEEQGEDADADEGGD